MGLLQGRRALVCGSSQGIGRAVAEQFARSGAEIVLLARDAGRLDAVVKLLDRGNDQNHRFVRADFADPDALKRILAAQLPEIGAIQILLNNTGGPPGGPIRDAGTDEFLDAFSKHLLCNQILVQAVLEGMKRGGFGRIINIVSTSVKAPIPGLGVSNTVRGAVASWAKTLAGELGPFGITVNNILPGYTETARLTSIIERKAQEMNRTPAEVAKQLIASIPLGRFARPEEIANAAEFLASDRASYITGVNLPVDGGRLDCL
ncbi:MAG: SDR family oxidoreductase [Methylococcaceae bacterium]|nr:SDR family oxidoreductase [Methylococcaceae bacterium]MCI0734045.1 SDR family oxidoreductase [Methylococcaceae bacterium]